MQRHLSKFFPIFLQKWSLVSYKRPTRTFILLMRFLLYSLVSSSFLVLLRYFFNFFFFSSSLVWWFPLPIFPSIRWFPCLRAFWFLSWFDSSIPYVMSRFPVLIWSMTNFSMSNSIPMSWLHIFTLSINFLILSHF